MEGEVFLLGIWKDFDELEESLSMDELMIVLKSKRESDYEIKKFHAALKGVDLDKETGHAQDQDFESFKDRVLSKHRGELGNDISTLEAREGLIMNESGEIILS